MEEIWVAGSSSTCEIASTSAWFSLFVRMVCRHARPRRRRRGRRRRRRWCDAETACEVAAARPAARSHSETTPGTRSRELKSRQAGARATHKPAHSPPAAKSASHVRLPAEIKSAHAVGPPPCSAVTRPPSSALYPHSRLQLCARRQRHARVSDQVSQRVAADRLAALACTLTSLRTARRS